HPHRGLLGRLAGMRRHHGRAIAGAAQRDPRLCLGAGRMKDMDRQVRDEVLRRFEADFGLKRRPGTDYMRGGTCPSCGKKELYSRYDQPWFVKCGRESKCGEQWHVKELFDDLFDDWSKRMPATKEEPTATAKIGRASGRERGEE